MASAADGAMANSPRLYHQVIRITTENEISQRKPIRKLEAFRNRSMDAIEIVQQRNSQLSVSTNKINSVSTERVSSRVAAILVVGKEVNFSESLVPNKKGQTKDVRYHSNKLHQTRNEIKD